MSDPRFDFTDSSMLSGKVQILSDGHVYAPAFLVGYFGDVWLSDYRGVGPSSAPYSMKACLRSDGVIFASNTVMRSFREQNGVCLLRRVCHVDDLPSHAIRSDYN